MKNKRMGIRFAVVSLALCMFAFAGCGKTEVPDNAHVFTGEKTVIANEALAEVRKVIPDFENFPMDKVGPGSNG